MKKLFIPLVVILLFMADIVLAETAAEWFGRGFEAYKAKKYDKAISAYKQAIKIDPNYANTHYNLGIAYGKKGMLYDAIIEFKKAISINPTDADVHYNLGAAYGDKGMIDEEIAAYKKVISLDPTAADAHNNLGLAYSKKGMLNEEIAAYKKAISLDPNYATAHHNLGLAYCIKKMQNVCADHLYKAGLLNIKQGNREDALKAYEVLKLTKSEELQKTLFKKLHPEVISADKKAISLDPNYATAHHNLGSTYYQKGMVDKAISEYKKALKINPDYAEAHYNLGVVYGKKGMVDEEISEYKKAIKIDPNYAEAHYNLGVVYVEEGMIDEAISEYKKVISINPNYVTAHFNLGATYVNNKMEYVGAEYLYKAGLLFLKQGDREKALKACEALKQFTKSKELEKALYKKLYPDIK
jgi:tetratricopeptide (TPR) repeat protein